MPRGAYYMEYREVVPIIVAMGFEHGSADFGCVYKLEQTRPVLSLSGQETNLTAPGCTSIFFSK